MKSEEDSNTYTRQRTVNIHIETRKDKQKLLWVIDYNIFLVSILSYFAKDTVSFILILFRSIRMGL